MVEGLRLPRPLREVPEAVTVLSRREIELSPQRSADDLLRTVPSAATFRRSSSLTADPTSQGANLRGVGPSGVSRTLVLHDGIPLNDPFGGWVYWRAVSTFDLDRVEVVPSGASALFGNFALGGVVQLHARPITGRRVEAIVSSGSLATHRAALRASDRHGLLAAAIDLDAMDSGGYAPVAAADRGAVDGDAPSRHLAGGARAELAIGDAVVRVHGRAFDQRLDAGTEHTTADVRTGRYGAALRWASEAGSLDVAAFAGHQRFEQTRARVGVGRASAALASRQEVPSTSQGAMASWTSRALRGAGQHVVLVGADALRVEGTSRETLLPAMPMPASVVARRGGGEQRFAGVYAQDAVRAGRLDITAAVRLDAWQNVDGATTATTADGASTTTMATARSDLELDPRLGVRTRMSDEVAFRASLYRSFRAPTLNELYRPFQVGTVLTDGNPDLRAETLWGAEVGPEVVVGTFVGRATAFWNELEDPINNVTLATPRPSGATRQRQNLGRARVRGLEVEASWRPSRRWVANAGYTFVEPRVTAAPGHPALVGRDLPQDPRHRATAALSFDDDDIATVTVQGRLTGRQYEDDRNTAVMARATVVDVLVARRLGRHLTVFGTVENVMDRQYLVGRAGVDTVGPPRMVQLGVRLDTGP